jgi:hypothetical protein
VVALIATACANKTVVVKVDKSIVTTLAAAQDAELSAHTTGVVSDDKHGQINVYFGDAWRVAREFNALVRAWPGTGPPPAELLKLAKQISDSLNKIVALLPPTDNKTLGYIQQALTIVNAVLAWTGGA